MTYFPTPSPEQYRRRWGVSLPCSGWERVGPPRSNHQEAYQRHQYAPFFTIRQGYAGAKNIGKYGPSGVYLSPENYLPLIPFCGWRRRALGIFIRLATGVASDRAVGA